MKKEFKLGHIFQPIQFPDWSRIILRRQVQKVILKGGVNYDLEKNSKLGTWPYAKDSLLGCLSLKYVSLRMMLQIRRV